MILQEIANEIYDHQKHLTEMDKITTGFKGITLEDAYQIQKINIDKDLQAGNQLVGWKMGLTSEAKQQSVGVNQPIYGRLLKSMQLHHENLRIEELIHPRVEPELAFLINRRLEGPNLNEKDVWHATECISPALEIIDSRYRDFSFNLIDVVADNASSAKFIISEQTFSTKQFHWDKIDVTMKLNGKIVQEGMSSAVLGHPVRSVLELVTLLNRSGQGIEPGMIVLTGGITEAIHVSKSDSVSVDFTGMGSMNLKFK